MIEDADIRDIRGPVHVPASWLLLVTIAAAIIVMLAIYAFWRRRRGRRERILAPYEIALQRLEQIRSLMQPASAREFTTAVSDIVRGYIEQRFAIAVTRQTTEEFLRDLAAPNAGLARYQSNLGEFLTQCDFVKFAAVSIRVNDMEGLLASARTFVLATAKPEEAAAVQEAGVALPSA